MRAPFRHVLYNVDSGSAGILSQVSASETAPFCCHVSAICGMDIEQTSLRSDKAR